MDTKTKYFLMLLMVGTFLFLFQLGGRDLWEPDETRYAVVAREMRQSGNWILPHLNGQIYAEKPPLFFWLVNISILFLGEDSELANRLPSVLAGLLAMVMTFLFGTELFNHRVGFFAGLVLSTCFLFPQISRWMMPDSIFTFLFLLSLFHFYRGYEKEEKRRRNYLLAGFFMSLGVLTKGPIAYLPIPIFLIFCIFQKEVKKFWNRNLLLGFFLSLAIIFIWLIPACWMGGEVYMKSIVFQQTLGRYVDASRHFHKEPFFFYFIHFPIAFFPWTVFLPAAFIYGYQKGEDKRKGFLFLFLWFSFIFLFFTLSKGKKDNYILPLYPAAALMVGVLWDSRFRSQERGKGFTPALFFLSSLFLMGFAVTLLGFPKRIYPVLEPYHFLALSILLYLLVGSGLCLLFFFKKMKWASFMSLAMTFVVFHLHLIASVPPKFNHQRSMKTLSENILKRMEMGDELKTCFFQSTGLLYYTKKPFIEVIMDMGRFHEVFHSHQRVFLVMQRRDLLRLEKEAAIQINPIEQVRIINRDFVLVSNR